MGKTFHKNPQIFVEDGKIIRLFLENICIERNFDFSSTVKEAMRDLAISSPLDFMELYFNLSNDEEFLKIASEIYEENIDKVLYPYEVMKSLYMSDVPAKPYNASTFIFGAESYKLVISDGLIIQIIHRNLPMESCYRNEIVFYSKLFREIYNIADSNVEKFMKFYEAVKNDPVAFKIADDVRKVLLKATQEKLEKTTKRN